MGTPWPRNSQGKHNQGQQPQTQTDPETIRKSKIPNLPVWTHTHDLVSSLFPSGPCPLSPRAHPDPPQFTVLPGLPSAAGGRLSSSAWRWRPCVRISVLWHFIPVNFLPSLLITDQLNHFSSLWTPLSSLPRTLFSILA